MLLTRLPNIYDAISVVYSHDKSILVVLFPVSLDRPSERGTARSLRVKLLQRFVDGAFVYNFIVIHYKSDSVSDQATKY